MGAHFSTVEMDNAIRFTIVSDPLERAREPLAQLMVLPVLPVQYKSGLEVLAYSIDIDFNNVVTMLQSYVHPLPQGCGNLQGENWIFELAFQWYSQR